MSDPGAGRVREPGDRNTVPRGTVKPPHGYGDTGRSDGHRVPSPHRQPSQARSRVLVASDGALRRLRLPRALRRAGLHVPLAVDPLRLGPELRRGGWDLMIWAGGRHELAREVLARGAPPSILVLDSTRGAAVAVAALADGFADVVRGDSVPELVARARGRPGARAGPGRGRGRGGGRCGASPTAAGTCSGASARTARSCSPRAPRGRSSAATRRCWSGRAPSICATRPSATSWRRRWRPTGRVSSRTA